MVAEDIKLWQEARKRITSKMSNEDFKTMCRLHAKYFNHKYKVICTCNKSRLRQWIFQLDDILI